MKSLSTALISMRRTPYQTLGAIFVVTITFLLAYTFSFFIYSSEKVLQFFESKPQVIAFFQVDASAQRVSEVAKIIQTKPYVEAVKIISKQEALELYKQDNQSDPLLLELVSAEILPASIEVAGKNLDSLSQIKADLEKLEGIDEIELPEDILNSLSFWTKSLRNLGLISIAVFGFESLVVILIVTSMKVSHKRNAITIMKLLGASDWFVASPFVFEGMIYGLLGSLIAWSLTNLGMLYISPWLKDFINPVPLFPIPTEFYVWQLGIGSLIATVLGFLASSTAVKRMIKR